MAEYNPALSNVEIADDEELVKKLPSIPSSDEVTAYEGPEHSHERLKSPNNLLQTDELTDEMTPFLKKC